MAASGASLIFADNFGEQVFLVTKPANGNSREIRDSILREYFGYTDADITELRQKSDKLFYVREDKEKDWASAAQVKKWKADLDGKISIPISQRIIDDITAFRDQRASFEIFKVGMFITDSSIKDEFSKDLDIILNKSGDQRISALNNLMVTIEGAGASRNQIYQALRFLTNESGYKNNPFLMIAFARTTIYNSSTTAISSSQVNQLQLSNAIKATNESLYNISAKNSLTKISKSEAAMINYWASDLYSKSNDENQAIQRRWIKRYLEIPDEERNLYNEGDIIEEVPIGATVLKTPSATEMQLREQQQKWAERQKMENDINNIGSPVPPSDPRSDEFFQKPTDKIEMKDSLVRQKIRGNPQGYVPKYKTVNVSTPVFREANIRANGMGAVVYILTEILRYKAANRRMSEIADYYNRRNWLLNQLEKEQRRVVPPKPERIKQAIVDVRKYGRTTVDFFVKRNIPTALRELEEMLEESYAFWKK
jgi:hypothetical protein